MVQIIHNDDHTALYPHGVIDMDEWYRRAMYRITHQQWSNIAGAPNLEIDTDSGLFKDVYKTLKNDNLVDEIISKLADATYAVWIEVSSRNVGTVELDDSMQAMHELADCELYAFHVGAAKDRYLDLRGANYQIIIGERVLHLWIDDCSLIKKILTAGKVNMMYDDRAINFGAVSLPPGDVPEWPMLPTTSIPLPEFLERLERSPPNPWTWTANVNIAATYPFPSMMHNFQVIASRLGE